MATLKNYRKRGVASAIMETIEKYAKENKIHELMLHAQAYIIDFYLHRNYIPQGEMFQEANIDHIKMTKKMNF